MGQRLHTTVLEYECRSSTGGNSFCIPLSSASRLGYSVLLPAPVDHGSSPYCGDSVAPVSAPCPPIAARKNTAGRHPNARSSRVNIRKNVARCFPRVTVKEHGENRAASRIRLPLAFVSLFPSKSPIPSGNTSKNTGIKLGASDGTLSN